MKVLLRGDASITQGTGHVMRLLTLAEALVHRGHEVHLLTNKSGIEWLEELISQTSLTRHSEITNKLSLEHVQEIQPDWVVVDSYVISSSQVNEVAKLFNLLAIVDGNARGITARLYLDHNLGAENQNWPQNVANNMLAGSTFALIRDSVISAKQSQPWLTNSALPKVLAFMGGSDPTGAIIEVGEVLEGFDSSVAATLIVTRTWEEQLREIFANSVNSKLLSPSIDLPKYLGESNIAISAAGTSAWELCTLGIPSIFISVMDNQDDSLAMLVQRGLGLGVGREESISNALGSHISTLLNDSNLRREISEKCLSLFDGKGKYRVVEKMESLNGD